MQRISHSDLTNADIASLRRLARSNVKLFFIWVCEAALGLPGRACGNPLLDRKNGGAEPEASKYSELARLLLDRSKGRVSAKRRSFDGYLSILESFAIRWMPPDRVDPVHFDRASAHRRKHEVVADLLRSEMLRFEMHARYLLEMVYHGMPLYRVSGDGARLEWISYADDDYIYLSKRGQSFDCIDIDSIPWWATSHWFKPADLDSYHELFGPDYRDPSVDEVSARRKAFRRHIGAPMGNVIGIVNTSASSLLDVVPALMVRFYGQGFNADDPDTWTTQVDVTDWIQKEFGVSRREAECLDVVLRSDQARRKGAWVARQSQRARTSIVF